MIMLIGYLLSNRPYYWMWSSDMKGILSDVIIMGMRVRIFVVGPLLSFMVFVSSCMLLGGFVIALRSEASSKVRTSMEKIFVVAASFFQVTAIFFPWLYARLGPYAILPSIMPPYRWNGWFYPCQVIEITSHGVFVSYFQDYWFGYRRLTTTTLGWLGVFLLQILTIFVATLGVVGQRFRGKASYKLGASIASLGTLLLGAYQYYIQKEMNGSLCIEASLGFMNVIISTILFFGAYLSARIY